MRSLLTLSLFTLAACDDAPGTQAEDVPVVADASHAGAVPALHTGTVKETMESGGYTYVLLQNDRETIWIAGPATPVAVGDTLTVPDGALMTAFHSATLDRTFDEIVFVDALHAGDVSKEAKACHDPGVLDQVAKFSTPDGGLAIDEVHARKAELVGKTVLVRGQVTKSSHGILGTNWIHLQDGTGVVAGKTFDLTVTTSNADIEIGDIVLVEGALSTDVDFGAGYKYDVIVQGAKVTAEPKDAVN